MRKLLFFGLFFSNKHTISFFEAIRFIVFILRLPLGSIFLSSFLFLMMQLSKLSAYLFLSLNPKFIFSQILFKKSGVFDPISSLANFIAESSYLNSTVVSLYCLEIVSILSISCLIVFILSSLSKFKAI